jgi:hypothetical protein
MSKRLVHFMQMRLLLQSEGLVGLVPDPRACSFRGCCHEEADVSPDVPDGTAGFDELSG